ncbi:MAG TPA: hypothetical protein VEB86_17540 [Chryseosolibacter sp.]|nr:hypothetical protein [Chryseosolibacter sp.]
MKRTPFVIAFWLSALPGWAQVITGDASVDPVTTEGFFRIELVPEITKLLNPDFGNIRILDANGTEVPYMFEEARPRSSVIFEEYPVIEKTSGTDRFTRLVIQNEKKTTINNISLMIKNADVTKTATLSGSDDGKKWFVLKEEFTLSTINSSEQTTEVNIVDFPLSNYEFYLIRINDKKSLPLNILKAGCFKNVAEAASYINVPVKNIEQADSLKLGRSYIEVTFDTARFVDKIRWNVSGGPYYRRDAALYEPVLLTDAKGRRTPDHRRLLAPLTLSSDRVTETDLGPQKVSSVVLIIENFDSPPVKVLSAETFQLRRYLIAWLKKDVSYRLAIGDENMAAPVYDLPFFRNEVPSQTPTLGIGKINFVAPRRVEAGHTFFSNSLIIWAAIVVVIIVLGVMSVRLVRETSASGK